MNYKIQVEGGFIGIPKTYEGAMVLSSEEISTVLDAIKSSSSENKNLRDGMTYVVEISHAGKVFKAIFDDKTVPEAIRKMIA